MKYIFLSILFSILLSTRGVFADEKTALRYVALGDSYTIGTGVELEFSWPSVMTKQLNEKGIPVQLITNLAVNGFTAQEVLSIELPIYKELKPDFATLLVGANDWVQGVEPDQFRTRLTQLMDELLKDLPNKDHLLIVTIPDFGVTPKGPQFSVGRDIAKGISEFNAIIKEEAKKRKLTVVDIFPLSQECAKDPAMISADGLHPSEKGYAAWEKNIYPAAEKILKEK